MKISANEDVKIRTKTSVNTSELVQAEMSKGAIRSLNIAGLLVGLWAAACIVGGMIAIGGPIALVRGWFSAVTGL